MLIIKFLKFDNLEISPDNKMNRNIKNYVARYFPPCHFHLLTMINSVFLGMKLFWKKNLDSANEQFIMSLIKRASQKLINYYDVRDRVKVDVQKYKYPSYKYIRVEEDVMEYLAIYKKNKRVLYFLQQGKFVEKILINTAYYGRIDIAQFLKGKFPIENFNFNINNYEGLIFCHVNNIYFFIDSYIQECITNKKLDELKKMKKYIDEQKLRINFGYVGFEDYCYLHNNDLIDEKLFKQEKIETIKDIAGIDVNTLKVVDKIFRFTHEEKIFLLREMPSSDIFNIYYYYINSYVPAKKFI